MASSNSLPLNTSKFFQWCVVLLVAIHGLQLGNCRRLSFKQSLTAFAEDSPFRNSSLSSLELSTPTSHEAQTPSTFEVPTSHHHGTPSKSWLKFHPRNSPTTEERRYYENELPSKEQLPLLQITAPRLQMGSGRRSENCTKCLNSPTNGSYENSQRGPPPSNRITPVEQQEWENFLTTMKNGGARTAEGSNGGTATDFNITLQNTPKSEDTEDEKRRSKKDAANSGFRDLMWSTAQALWSANKVHFLPTFLHTKTGGKLSLIRESIFKPVSILSQFRSGVREINNEKLRNLFNPSSTGGMFGWGSSSRPVAQLLTKLLWPKTPILTVARYALRLSKHTVVTKWRLKRALFDLQVRALKKFIRVVSNRNIVQKLAAARMLAGALWKAKRTFFQSVTKPSTTEGYYKGKDNSNVDISYSSQPQNNPQHGWPSSVPQQGYSVPASYPASNFKPPSPQYNYDSWHSSSDPQPLIQASKVISNTLKGSGGEKGVKKPSYELQQTPQTYHHITETPKIPKGNLKGFYKNQGVVHPPASVSDNHSGPQEVVPGDTSLWLSNHPRPSSYNNGDGMRTAHQIHTFTTSSPPTAKPFHLKLLDALSESSETERELLRLAGQ